MDGDCEKLGWMDKWNLLESWPSNGEKVQGFQMRIYPARSIDKENSFNENLFNIIYSVYLRA